MAAVNDVMLLLGYAAAGLAVLAAWAALAIGFGVLVGRVIRRRDEQVEMPTEELDISQLIGRTDTVLMRRVGR